jgi:hypothetical protein
MPVDSTATTAIAYANTQVDPNILAKYTNAVDIQSTPYDKGWLYHIECRNPRTYDEFSEALTATEIHLKTRCFLPILDDGGSTNGKIILNPPKDAFMAPRDENDLLIPGLKRLSKQLKVDFATNVHGSEGKRRREKTRTIYDEDVLPETKKPYKPRVVAAKPHEDTHSFTEKKPKERSSPPPTTERAADPINERPYSFAEKALDAINDSHAQAVAAKDETIRALTSALAMKDDLLRTQASLIALLQR